MALTDRIIVLDVDETLVNTSRTKTMDNIISSCSYDSPERKFYSVDIQECPDYPRMWGSYRPHLDKFILFCNVYFEKVIIWSAGQKGYVEPMTEKIFMQVSRKPDLIYSHDRCKFKERILYKPLRDLEQYGVSLDKALVVDDRETTYIDNPENGILIPPYVVDPETPCSHNNPHSPCSNIPQSSCSLNNNSCSLNSPSFNNPHSPCSESPCSEQVYSNPCKEHEDDHLYRLACWLMLPEVLSCPDYRTLIKSDIFDVKVEHYHKYLYHQAPNNLIWLKSIFD